MSTGTSELPRLRVAPPADDHYRQLIACQTACPVHTDARGYVRAIAERSRGTEVFLQTAYLKAIFFALLFLAAAAWAVTALPCITTTCGSMKMFPPLPSAPFTDVLISLLFSSQTWSMARRSMLPPLACADPVAVLMEE